jgi:ribosomal protein L11 methyltransferase
VVYSLSLTCAQREKDMAVAELYEAGTLGVIEEDLPDGRCRLRAFFGEEAPAEGEDWVRAAQSQWQPVVVGERWFLAPAWHDGATPPGRLRLVMPPGAAFGTGLHPSTQAALEAMERTVRAGDVVLDLGTGSGILAAAARLLEASATIACDIDEDAARVAREYCGEAAAVFAGSVRSLRDGWADVVAANIHAAAIASLAGEIARILKPGGRAILSGFTSQDAEGVARAVRGAGLVILESISRDDWTALIAGPEN